jgi:hypothetical protein
MGRVVVTVILVVVLAALVSMYIGFTTTVRSSAQSSKTCL